MSRSNVLVIVLDSLRRDKVSVYNREVDFTGNLQDFADEATVFEDAVANAPWTLASHASMFTGMYPWEHNATQRNLQLEVEKDLLAERLAGEGYRSKCITVNGFLSGHFGLTEGFDSVENLSTGGFSQLLTKARRIMDGWLATPGYERLKRIIVRVPNMIFHYWGSGSKTGEILEKSREFMLGGEEPFFLFLNLMDPHEPYFPPEEYRERHGAPHPRKVCQDPTDFYFGRKQPDFDGIHRIYDSSVDFMDDLLGEFFDWMKQEDLWDDTSVVVTSDHGQMLGEDGEYGHQFTVAEPLVTVPLLVKGMEEERIEKQVELREMYDLVLSIAGLEDVYRPGVEFAKGGYDFPDMMRPRIPPGRWNEFYRRHSFVRTGNGKIIRSETGDGELEERFEYGDLSPEEKKRLRRELDSIDYSGGKGAGLEERDREIQRKLKNLGYG